MNDGWSQPLADELHKPIRKNFVRRRVIVSGIKMRSGLMQTFSGWNKGVKYLLNVIDVSVFKVCLSVPLKGKTGKSIIFSI